MHCGEAASVLIVRHIYCGFSSFISVDDAFYLEKIDVYMIYLLFSGPRAT